jgi:hypothetical protein
MNLCALKLIRAVLLFSIPVQIWQAVEIREVSDIGFVLNAVVCGFIVGLILVANDVIRGESK